MKILLINSDVAKNRGDRAIAEGLLELIRTHQPDAKITGLSEESERDEEWYSICLLYTSPSPRDATLSRMPSSA